uniref:Uncharacterized protein n=1 Tax=Monopterus albus TaxID=43700 RepID=A0A3Q3K1H8_MONAL
MFCSPVASCWLNTPVARVMNTPVGQYLSSHPFLGLALMLFSTMAALPVGLFLVFALVTAVMSAVACYFSLPLSVFLLSVGGLTLLCVLSGLALFSTLVSFIINAFYFIIFTILSYYPQMTKSFTSTSQRSYYC